MLERKLKMLRNRNIVLFHIFMFNLLQAANFSHTTSSQHNNVLPATNNTCGIKGPIYQYRFMYLVQQWEVSACNQRPRQCLKPATAGFSIRGLWPSSYSRDSLSKCRAGSKFSLPQIWDLQARLETEWRSLLHENNTELWKEEWERHGICSESVLSQHDFFRTALELKKRYNLLNMLANQGILPLSNVYGTDRIRNAIRTATGYRPLIGCNLYNKIPQLSLIYLCFDHNATNMIHCPSRRICQHEALLFPYDPLTVEQ